MPGVVATMLVGFLGVAGISPVEAGLFVCLLAGGLAAWRSKRGDFYKEQATEWREAAETYRRERDEWRAMTDITPILKSQERVANSLERHAVAMDATVTKLAEMNGSVKANTVALEALAHHLILDEASRSLLHAASDSPAQRRRRRPDTDA